MGRLHTKGGLPSRGKKPLWFFLPPRGELPVLKKTPPLFFLCLGAVPQRRQWLAAPHICCGGPPLVGGTPPTHYFLGGAVRSTPFVEEGALPQNRARWVRPLVKNTPGAGRRTLFSRE